MSYSSKDINSYAEFLRGIAAKNSASKASEKSVAARDKEHIENEDRKQNIKLKRSICDWVKLVVSIYLVVIGVIIFLIIFKLGSLSDSVLIALLTTTTINILGLPLMIIMSLFPKEK